MPRDNYNTRSNNKKKKINNKNPDSDDNGTQSDSDSVIANSPKKLRKFLNDKFPSTYLKNKIKNDKKSKKKSTSDEDNFSDDESEFIDDESESEYVDDDDESEYVDDDSDNKLTKNKKEKSKISNYSLILVNESDKNYDDLYDYNEFDDEDTDYETENEDDPISTDTDDEDSEGAEKTTSSLTQINTPILNQLKELLSQNPNDKAIQKCIDSYEADVRKKEKKIRERNCRIFRHVLKEKQKFNDYDYYEKMDVETQKKIIKELKLLNENKRHEKPYRISILESDIPMKIKSIVLSKVNFLSSMDSSASEYYKIKSWIDHFMKIPFGKYNKLPISINDGVDKCHEFMHNAQQILNEKVYGLNDAKMQIMQLLGQIITNPNAIGSAVAIHGPPGTGKTSLVQNALSEILGKPCAFVPLGGAGDSGFLEGHSYTYEGSTYGKIVQILIDSKCMNPIIYFDELDKISESPRGEEIIGILTHLIDTTQNTHFNDKYFTELSFDLSKCLFVFSYNDESKINPVLKDRMYRIQTKGYNLKQKTTIATNYLLPKIREQIKFNSDDIIINEQIFHYIIENFCNKEDGVRTLKRSLEIIFTKLNLYRLMRPDTNLFEEDMSIKVTFPFTITREIVDKLIKKPEINQSFYMLYT
jgi:ATP-dependent Lon protease